MIIRPASAGDRPFLFSLCDRLALAGEAPWRDRAALTAFQERFMTDSLDAAGARTLVAEEEDGSGPLGFLTVEPRVDPITEEPVGYVSLLAVTPAAEGRGVAARLMAAAEDLGRAEGWRALTLEVFGANTRGRAFYARRGFAEDTLSLRKGL